MFKIYYSESAISTIKGFIRAYEEAFFELYRDSGLVTEQKIIKNYRLSARKLNEQIFLEIEKHLGVKRVLGRKERGQWHHELAFYVGSRLITVFYTTDDEDSSKTIESIGIERKPIIF
ncbi:MAG: hypothetical protein UY76_C0021G0013 [Candidatus Uhrbacteria bacterium GW2011_GWA2_52_8d]|uniref:Plasmid stabilization system n=1 Tax=Candidatus Uhrbacteria bacterium GW2011_GWA2_52_8d TaxID=1618979 RepID=A0A0G1ZWC0_9BACT|nr:MAG: hypothetical protein UY76_C0021G0013 [Candidatus Uhrbacteria bacterium GW2011_GWA2_52_8d]